MTNGSSAVAMMAAALADMQSQRHAMPLKKLRGIPGLLPSTNKSVKCRLQDRSSDI